MPFENKRVIRMITYLTSDSLLSKVTEVLKWIQHTYIWTHLTWKRKTYNMKIVLNFIFHPMYANQRLYLKEHIAFEHTNRWPFRLTSDVSPGRQRQTADRYRRHAEKQGAVPNVVSRRAAFPLNSRHLVSCEIEDEICEWDESI